MSVSFVELAGSPSITMAGTRLTAQRIFRVAWDDWYDFAKELLGHWTVVGSLRFLVPPKQFPGLDSVYVTGMRIEAYMPSAPDGTATLSDLEHGYNHYQYARITVQYGVPQATSSSPTMPTIPTGTYLEYESDHGGQFLTTGTEWKWASDSSAIPSDISPGLYVPTTEHQLVWYQVPTPPWSSIRSATGKINSDTFLGASAGTVLFTGASCSRVFQFARDDVGNYWTVRYNFSEKGAYDASGGPYGWNYFYRGDKAGGHFDLIKDTSTGNYAYTEDSNNFANLFAF